jgi:uncharacterized protein (TIGR02597 family)
MKPQSILHLVPLALGLSLNGAFAQSAVSPAIGFNKVDLKGASDSLVSLPFQEKPTFTGKPSSAPTEAGEDIVVTVTGSNWGALGGSNYVRITSGMKDGYFYEISENTATTLKLEGHGDDLSTFGVSDTFSIIPHSTLDSTFPSGNTAIHPSTNPISVNGSEVFILDNVTMALNKPAAESYFYYNGGWRKRGVAFTLDFGSFVLKPGTHFIVRHKSGAADTIICVDGRVPASSHVIQIDADVNGNDNFISIDRPVDVLLNDFSSNLVASGAFTASTNPISVNGDEIFIYDNSQVLQNKPASASYFYYNSAWRLRGGSFTVDVGADPAHALKPGEAVVLRKKASAPASFFLKNEPAY